ncbi:hypothetical protein FA10DRAFT_277730 [Acaromyces ingoldii]|uniref:Uncharacterized protein n=1 Tax=Acaromyces ingoldii TaxID=215250 RepID=A0A316Z1M6_9BASI|nr:hypothetical protein FA10DRAFT_277730 [Acaromyces ingoldii]PWN94083.1 hypothetical protein FA10DRAFT_277730 [Acaromyces ingoldii]
MDYHFEDKPFPLFARWNDGETQCTSDCLTTTVYETQYYDEHGRTTTCLTTATETTWQPARPPATPAPGQPATTTVNVQTVTMTQTSIIKEGSQMSPTAAAPMPSPSPHPPTSPTAQPPAQSTKSYDLCDCERQWVKLFLGGLPHGAGEVFACLAFFFPLAVLLVVCFLRVLRWGLHDREILFLLLPTLLFLLLFVAALPTRAYVATNGDAGIDTTNHYLAQHVLFTIAPSLLVESALQLYGFLSRRSVRGQWVDSSALGLRVVNFVALVLYIVASATFVGFVNGWQVGTTSCWSHTPAFVGRLTIVADILELIVLALALIW